MVSHVTMAIDTDQHLGSLLAEGRSFHFATACHMGFMKAIDLVRKMDPSQPLLALMNHFLDQPGVRFKLVIQSFNPETHFVCSLGVRLSDLFCCMVNRLRDSFHSLLNISTELAQPCPSALVSIFAQLMNLNNHHLTQFAETSNPFYLIHSVSKTPTSGLQLHFTKAHPLDVSMQALNNLLIRMITKMLQYMQPHHKANLLTSMPLSTLIRQQSIDEIVPINVISEKKKFVILLEGS